MKIDGKLRVMLVDDHALVRSAVRQALTAPDVEFVGEAANAAEAMALAPVLRPDVLLLDIDLPVARAGRLLPSGYWDYACESSAHVGIATHHETCR